MEFYCIVHHQEEGLNKAVLQVNRWLAAIVVRDLQDSCLQYRANSSHHVPRDHVQHERSESG